MQGLCFDELFACLSAAPLSSNDLARLRDWITSIRDPSECLALVEAAAADRPCPHCGCARRHRSGHASGLQRFRCLGCRRSYNALTGTPLARLRKRELWLPYIQCLLESRTVRDAPRATARLPCRRLSRPTKPTAWNRRRDRARSPGHREGAAAPLAGAASTANTIACWWCATAAARRWIFIRGAVP